MEVIKFKTSNRSFLFIKLPENATKPVKGLFPACLWYEDELGFQITDFSIPLKLEDKIIGFVKDLKEEDWLNIVDEFCDGHSEDCWFNYNQDVLDYTKESALESAQTLLDTLNIDLKENWLLIKII